MAANIETSFHAAIDAKRIHGVVICATNSESSFEFKESFGTRTLLSGEKRPQALDDVLFLASATKILTTIAVLKCTDQGLLSLDGD
ncbi:transesterase [Penicillium lividum]|nr:transesterase [Penicillium lividum]